MQRGFLRFCLPVLAAGLISNGAFAGAQEDYEEGQNYFWKGDMITAMASLRKAVSAGHVKAMVLLAQIYDISEFDEDAIDLYRQAVKLGDPEAMLGLGNMIGAGEGVPARDPVEALSWIRKSAELGHVPAINALAQAYIRADNGISDSERNSPEALRWVKEAAQKDFLPAVEALVEAYRTGGMLSVSADPELAARYLAQANKLRNIDGKGKKKKRPVAG